MQVSFDQIVNKRSLNYVRKRENKIDLLNKLKNLNNMQTRKLEELRKKARCEINKILLKKNELSRLKLLVPNESKKYKKLIVRNNKFVNSDDC